MIKDLLNGNITQKELLAYYNANVTYIDLKKGIDGLVFCYKGIYNIIINKNLSKYKRKKTLLHELAHIELNQLDQYNKDLFEFQIQDYEDEADKYIKELLLNWLGGDIYGLSKM